MKQTSMFDNSKNSTNKTMSKIENYELYEPTIELMTMDCMDYMEQCNDKQFDLAIVDPPYGINIHKMSFTQSIKAGLTKRRDYSWVGNWDNDIPPKEYWKELMRVSKNQIIWGGNYFSLPPTKSWIFWDKKTHEKYSNDYADGELAWTSFNKPIRCFRWLWNGMLQQNMKDKQQRIHPTEKPKALYEWLLMNFAQKGDKIIDTHLGSGSIAMACWNMKYDLVGMDVNERCVKSASKRLNNYRKQLNLFR